ncbi:MAG: Mitochondrial distribution and morphology protein 12 [Claussenomyces sp. TS43310]|nr:MAG: Mitochondrial distribution and morphology protein 12 [Claussenomyces sp. TS43310]
MSIDLNWESLTTGPDGIALAESIRDFIHERFQAVTLPRFLRTVTVHSFDFGAVAPEVEIKDICDPLPDFYQEEHGNGDDGDSDADDDDEDENRGPGWQPGNVIDEAQSHRDRRKGDRDARTQDSSRATHQPSYIDTRAAGLRFSLAPGELGSPFLGASTPGIPGGTSNLNYFHSQLATGLSGTHTPLAAVAGAHFPNKDFAALPSNPVDSTSGSSVSRPSTGDSAQQQQSPLRERDGISTPAASSAATRSWTQDGPSDEHLTEESTAPPRRFREPRVEDLQMVFRVHYSGDVRLSLTAEILLDYPMPSFVGIPVKLNITGLSFDGVAVLAYIRKKAHFCFLSPEDALTSLGTEIADGLKGPHDLKMGGLLQEIKVESEIGQRENGKQVLKNVGKVEKFVLEQVRRIFEDEFVYPSFWTFLV